MMLLYAQYGLGGVKGFPLDSSFHPSGRDVQEWTPSLTARACVRCVSGREKKRGSRRGENAYYAAGEEEEGGDAVEDQHHQALKGLDKDGGEADKHGYCAKL